MGGRYLPAHTEASIWFEKQKEDNHAQKGELKGEVQGSIGASVHEVCLSKMQLITHSITL